MIGRSGAGRRGSGRRGRPFWLPLLALVAVAAAGLRAQPPAPAPVRGFTHPGPLAAAYDAILDADFAHVSERLAPACPDVPVLCDTLQAVSVWWQIALDPEDRRHDARFQELAERAIVNAEAWTRDEPRRAEAWFARGAAYSARAQWKVQRNDRLSAARDGKHIKEALERALAIDPGMDDARFGFGMYRYYADIAPAALRLFRWFLRLPGGDRDGGLAQMERAGASGVVLRGEAAYQLHLVYLWYENRADDAVAIIDRLQSRYPHNPLFALIAADIDAVYFHDRRASEQTLRALIDRAAQARVHAPGIARERAERALDALHARRTP